MRVCYLCDFDLRGRSGKERATKQKLEGLNKNVARLYVVSGRSSNLLLKLVMLLILDIFASAIIVIRRPHIFISRGYVGLISLSVCRVLGVRTVREVHSDLFGELNLLPFNGLKKRVLYLMLVLQNYIDRKADVRIFNHPDLMVWHHSTYGKRANDFYCYNGFDPVSKSSLTKAEARERFGLQNDKFILVFTGAASEWHGVEYVVNLQREFDRCGDPISIVCGGGDISRFDRERICFNFTPLDDIGCADLIAAADLCLLPVKFNRVTPGSPLKLYDYILNQRYVISQAATNGYSDEVLRYNVGWEVDFSDAESARNLIVGIFDSKRYLEPYPACKASWEERMRFWLSALEGTERSSSAR